MWSYYWGYKHLEDGAAPLMLLLRFQGEGSALMPVDATTSLRRFQGGVATVNVYPID